jgi:hypothetical protein
MASQPQDQKGGGKERNTRPETEPGAKLASNKKPDSSTEKVDGKKQPGAWGELPDYILQHGRGSMPNVPEQYRKYLEALTRQNQENPGAKK